MTTPPRDTPPGSSLREPGSSLREPGSSLREPGSSLQEVVERALREDLGGELSAAADLTTRWTVPAQTPAGARILARSPGVVAGLDAVRAVFLCLDSTMEIDAQHADGDAVLPDATVVCLAGSASAILVGERTALNFLQQLSGVATLTRAYVDAVAGTNARITDTRKTIAGLRYLQKHAVRCGGGVSHRFGLHDAVLIKENHAAAAGGVAEAVRRARQAATAEALDEVRVMCEAETHAEVCQLVAGDPGTTPDRILLDNMTTDELRRCVETVRAAAPHVDIEATGNVSLQTVRAIAEAGVDIISVGALTHSAPALDLSLLFD